MTEESLGKEKEGRHTKKTQKIYKIEICQGKNKVLKMMHF